MFERRRGAARPPSAVRGPARARLRAARDSASHGSTRRPTPRSRTSVRPPSSSFWSSRRRRLAPRDACGRLAAQTYPRLARARRRQRLRRRLGRDPRQALGVGPRAPPRGERRRRRRGRRRARAPASRRRPTTSWSCTTTPRWTPTRSRGSSRPPIGIEGVEGSASSARRSSTGTTHGAPGGRPLRPTGSATRTRRSRTARSTRASTTGSSRCSSCRPCAMLVSGRRLAARSGSPDERLESHHEDLDLLARPARRVPRGDDAPGASAAHGCDPKRLARARSATGAGRATTASARRSPRCSRTTPCVRSSGPSSLCGARPRAALGLMLARRFEELVDLLAAWGWNVVHLPGTLRRRVRSQSVRTVSDRAIRRFMESSGVRIPRWFEPAGEILAEQAELDVRTRARAPVCASDTRPRRCSGRTPSWSRRS